MIKIRVQKKTPAQNPGHASHDSGQPRGGQQALVSPGEGRQPPHSGRSRRYVTRREGLREPEGPAPPHAPPLRSPVRCGAQLSAASAPFPF